jgi:hypothetical protein
VIKAVLLTPLIFLGLISFYILVGIAMSMATVIDWATNGS